jgi:beta-N-acetylhexosaminidase
LSSRHRDDARPRAVILGCAGPVLTAEERQLFAVGNPLGFILFARNIVDPGQVAALTRDLRASVGRQDAPILVDQEGGRVRRLRPPHWRPAPAAATIGALWARAPHAAAEAARLAGRLIAAECLSVGFDVVCAPCADLPEAGAHDVIGDRAFGYAPDSVATLARAMALGLAELGVTPVVKHMPGHGRARADSHHELPIVTAMRAELEATDAVPFRALSDMPWGMTAHVLYTALDAERPGTVSPAVIRFIRDTIGFGGVLLSDDLGMQALGGTPLERAQAALTAGCDIALHCDGRPETAAALLTGLPLLDDAAWARLGRTREMVDRRLAPEPQRWQGRLDALLSGAAL